MSRSTPRRARCRAAALVAAILGAACSSPPPRGPDLVLTDGRIRLGDLREPVAALAIDGDRIVATGPSAEIRDLATEDAQEMSLEDATVLPGLVDAWIDLEATGRWSEGLDLRRAVSPREVQALLRAAGPGTDGGWIVGWGWDETLWPSPELPDRTSLDGPGDTPILLYRRIGRVGWVNSAALAAADLESAGDATMGLFRDADGAPTGIVAGKALERVEAAIPPPTAADRKAWIEAGLRAAAAAGITTVSTSPVGRDELSMLDELHRAGDVPVHALVRLRPEELESALAAGRDRTGRVRVRGIGLVLDGPLRPPLAALATPYGGSAETGPALDREAIESACALAGRHGVALDVRATGDRAVTEALAACPALAAGRGLVVGGDVWPAEAAPEVRLAAIPLQLTHDLYWIEERLGADRAARTHAYRDRLAAGQLAALASAAPEHDLDTAGWLLALSRRRDRSGYPIDGWHPDQRISMGDALRIATSGLGSLDGEGDPIADLVVWSEDPFDPEIDPASLRPLMTVVGGRVVYSRPLVDVPFDIR